MSRINDLILEMIDFDAGRPELIQHLIKVYKFAELIGSMENLSSGDMEVLEAAAVVHDKGSGFAWTSMASAMASSRSRRGLPMQNNC